MKYFFLFLVLCVTGFLSGCSGGGTSNTDAPAAPTTTEQTLVVVERPTKISSMMKERGGQDSAKPTLKILAPADGATIDSSTVKVKLALSGDLKGYKPGMHPETHTGNHIHVILDNQPYEAYYNLDQEFELRNVSDGPHTLRVFPSRPWHESYKNEGAFQMVKFTVANGGGDAEKPATTADGETMSNSNEAKPTPEGKEMKESSAGEVDPKKPLLTFSRPKGEYKGIDAAEIMVDFWLHNAKLVGDGGTFRVRYTIDGGEPEMIDKWQPFWIARWAEGKHSIKLELVDENGNVVENGGYNSTTRDFTVSMNAETAK